MKTKTFNKKLVLKKETVVNLSAVAMKDIKAGNSPATFTCFITIDYACQDLYEDIKDASEAGSNLC